MATKEDLVETLQKKGVILAHMGMTKKELEGLVKDYKEKQKQELTDEANLKALKKKREETKEKKKVKKIKDRIAVPVNCLHIREEDIRAERVRTDEYVVVFNDGPKHRYSLKDFQRLTGRKK